jgi:hypothetical protein
MSYSSSVQGIGLLLSLSNSILPGCTDPAAFNYNPAATLNDNSCIAVVLGCTEPTANNYSASANVDSSFCTWAGCTDPTAFNYNSVIVANASIYGTTATNDGTCIAIVNGCTDPTSFNYNSSANTNDGSCIAVVNGCTNPTSFNYNALANTNDGSCIAVVNGCTNVTACNYNNLANTDDGSCTYPPSNANCAGNCLTGYTSVGGVCVAIVTGCTDSTSLNYNAAANIDDGSCIAVVNGCTDATAFNYNAAANTDDGSCIAGCTGTAPITGNYVNTTTNTAAIHWDDMNTGVCVVEWYQVRYKVSGASAWTTLLSTTTNSQNISSLIPATTYEYEMKIKYVGSASAVAWGYNPSGQFTTSSCPSGTVLLNGGCVPAVNGCMDPSACNYDVSANVNDLSCTYPAANADCAGACLSGYTLVNGACVTVVTGCTDSTQFNYSASANVDDGSCIPIAMGCTNPTATNYNATANTDDGSCIFPAAVVQGCMDPNACNFDAAATTAAPWTNKKLCIYPIPNAYITVGGTNAAYGATGPAYFKAYPGPSNNTGKFVKHIVNQTGWPLTTIQQHDMGLSFRWGEPGADMNQAFSSIGWLGITEQIHVKLLKQSNPVNAASPWNSVYTKDYSIPNWTALGNEVGHRNYGGNTNVTPYSYPESFGSGQNAANNYNFAVYYNSTVKNKYRVDISQTFYSYLTLTTSVWGGYSGIQSPAGNVDCGGRFQFEIADLPCSAADPNLTVFGCTNPNACNYDSTATCDDSSCYYGTASPFYQPIPPCGNGCSECGTCNGPACDPTTTNYTSMSGCIADCGSS